ncbi:hypothetical protein Asi02nite_65650 [Asanoa siamensis]|uniref:Uncharacterized protein n=1 Tax=Asanoa siamensis TaxID=926357 RepID=A0ABQ4D1R7_9ACTN|nr:hypothetical protein Asi02nite_65650 [Asanoa siamensis]
MNPSRFPMSTLPRTGRDRRDDMRKLADEHRLVAIEDDHRFGAFERVAEPTTQPYTARRTR